MQAATHPRGAKPKIHHFEFKLSEGNIAYRISNNSYVSQQIWKEDYELFRKHSAKFGILYCNNWKKNTPWQPLKYNCVPSLKVAIPQDMLDPTTSTNSGINILQADEISHPTLLAAAALTTILFFLFCGLICCCQLTSCGGTARCAGWRIQQVLVTSKPQSSAGAQYRHTSRVWPTKYFSCRTRRFFVKFYDNNVDDQMIKYKVFNQEYSVPV